MFSLSNQEFARRLQLIFSGSPIEGRVYAKLPLTDQEESTAAGLTLSGLVRGPECELSHTLPATFQSVGRETDSSSISTTIFVPDVCPWTPELPFLYNSQFDLLDHDRVVATCCHVIGMRRWETDGADLRFDSKRFVLRGVWQESSSAALERIESETEFIRSTWTALVVPGPSDALCEIASHQGILLVADMRGLARSDRQEMPGQLRRVELWPAVAAVLIPDGCFSDMQVVGAIRKLVVAQFMGGAATFAKGWVLDAAFVEVDHPDQFAKRVSQTEIPIIAVRRLKKPTTIESARGACDALQRDLAPYGDFAGYIV